MLETPFLNGDSRGTVSGITPPTPRSETPFLSEYPTDGEDEAVDAQAETIDELLESLHDEELDEAIAELTEELRERVAALPVSESEQGDVREAMLMEAVAPLLSAAEADLSRAAQALEALDLSVATEEELEAAVDALPLSEAGHPVFEQFLNRFRKAIVKKVVKVAKAVGQVALGPFVKFLMGQLASFAKPVLIKIVKFALNKVPAAYRPLVASLGAKLGIPMPAAPTTTAPSVPPEPTAEPAPPDTAVDPTAPALDAPATPDVAQAQEELDLALTELALGGTPLEREMEEAVHYTSSGARDPYAGLRAAREVFAREITEAAGVEEAQVAVERFAPAVLLAVRKGIGMIGRPKVVNAFGGVIAKIVRPVAGDKAQALGRLLADLGLRTFLHAEVGPETEREEAGEALASTVEETLRRVARVPAEMLEEPEALAAYTREAFESAAAANFPAAMVRPELRETERSGAWVRLPRRGRAICRKFSHVFPAVVTPAIAARVRGYGSSTLSGLFRDRLRLAPDKPVSARVHVYEAVPGTTLGGIARLDEVRGLGSAETAVWSQIQPLTPEAAALLVGSPRLGRELPDDAVATVPRLGQRFYFLEVANAPARPLGRESAVRATLDLRRREMRLSFYLSEVVAQKMAAALRAKSAAATVISDLRRLLAPTLAAFTEAPATVRVRGARRRRGRGPRAGAPVHAARRAARRQLGALALGWAWQHLAGRLSEVAADVIAKADAPEDGLRLVFTFHLGQGLDGIARLFRGHGRPGDGLPAAPARTSFRVHAGPRHV
jgi:hypothetical protein